MSRLQGLSVIGQKALADSDRESDFVTVKQSVEKRFLKNMENYCE